MRSNMANADPEAGIDDKLDKLQNLLKLAKGGR